MKRLRGEDYLLVCATYTLKAMDSWNGKMTKKQRQISPAGTNNTVTGAEGTPFHVRVPADGRLEHEWCRSIDPVGREREATRIGIYEIGFQWIASCRRATLTSFIPLSKGKYSVAQAWTECEYIAHYCDWWSKSETGKNGGRLPLWQTNSTRESRRGNTKLHRSRLTPRG